MHGQVLPGVACPAKHCWHVWKPGAVLITQLQAGHAHAPSRKRLQETLAGNPFSAFISFRLAGRRSCMCDSACTNCSRSALPTSTNTTNLQANACRRTFWPAWHGTYDAAEQLPQHALTQTDLYKICSHRIRPTAQIKSGPPPPIHTHTHSTYPCVLQATRQQPKCRPVE